MRFKVASILIICSLGCLMLGCANGQNSSNEKELPNIIFLLTDDQRWDALGANGNTDIKTPNLDQLAESGFNFKNAYVTTSICMVSRASILTGQYMSRHGITDFGRSLSDSQLANTYPALLKKKGYRIGFVGKYGVGNPEDQPKQLFDFWAGTPLHQPNYETINEDGQIIHYTDLISNDISRFLETFDNQSPFCLSVSFKSPHSQDGDPRQFIPKKKYEKLYDDLELKRPFTASDSFYRLLPDILQKDENIARQRWALRFKTQEMFEQSVKNYYRLITGVDEAVGQLVKELRTANLDKNTIIIFMGDNGFYLGEHGLAGKWFGHEESIRVPLIIYDPRFSSSKGAIEKMALNIDIAPTILGFANIQQPEDMQGMDLMKVIENKLTDRSDFLYEHSFLGSPQLPKVEGVVSTKLKYMLYPENGQEELFDLSIDPYEIHNLVDSPKYKSILSDKRKRFEELKNNAR